MFKFPLALFSCLLVISCAFHRQKNQKHSGNYIASHSPDSVSIFKKLDLSEKNLKTKTGIYTLESGGRSLLSRLWLFDHAQKSIDIQYYSIAKDVTGSVACDYIVRAADRGVKVRILIDDAATKLSGREIKLLDSHKNIDVHIYNAGLKLGRMDRRLKKLAKNSNRLLRRMHNKTVTIDDQICISGGRNIADEYYDYDHRYNFRDRDVMLLGKAVEEVKVSYEKFWNDTLCVAYSTLRGKKKKNDADTNRFNGLHKKASKDFSMDMREQVNVFPDSLKLGKGYDEIVWVDQVSFVSDIPGKNEGSRSREGGVCNDSICSLIKQAKISIDIQSPYFITTPELKQLITETIQRGVKIRLLTNSMESTDNHEAFSGYQKDRNEILKAGVEIHEFKPDAAVRYKLMIPEIQARLKYKPAYGLHSKTLIIDKRIAVIGSYNMDPRSANYNTECISILRSETVAANLLKYIEEEFLPENAWDIAPDHNPDSKAGLRKRIKVALRRILPKKLL
ncbi:MAG: ymdC [Bacteroidetes bacterium]|nr:ymdC [Bacteroidota bacterium]